MRHLRQWETRAGFFIVSLLFASFIIAPSALAATSYTWTDNSTTDTATANQSWISITSDSTGQHLAAVVIGGDIWTATADNPSLAQPNNNSTSTTGSNTSSSTYDPKAPNTGYGQRRAS